MGYYYSGGLNISSAIKEGEKAWERIRQKIRNEAAEGARPAAKQGVKDVVVPIAIGIGTLSLLSLIIALRR